MVTSSSYLLKIGADVGSVTKSIAQINGDIRSLANQSRNLNSAFKLTGDTSILTKNISVLEKQLTATQNKSKSLKSQLASMQASKGFDVNSVKAQKLTRDIELTESQVVKLKSELASAKTGGLDQAIKSTSSLTQKLGVGTVAMGSFIGAIGATVVGKAFSLITNNVQGAITRIDTLTNATRNFQNMGVKTSVVNTQMNNLKNAINGLPTSLDSAVSGVQLLTSSLNGNMPQSVSVFKALNDGILGFGGTTEQVTNSITQLSQAFSNGKIDAETWNSLIDSGLGPTLNAMAKQMGITTGALKSGLSDGSISVSQFNDALVNLDKNGGGGIASLSKIAQDSTSGIGTSIANAKTAVTRGVADMITAVNNGIKSLDITTPLGKITGIGSIISQLGTVVEQTFEAIGQAIPQAFSGLSGVISSLVGSGNQIQTLFATISTTISGVLGTMDFSALTNLAQAILPALQSGFQTFLGYVTPAIQPLLNAFVNLWNAIQPIVNVIASSLMPVFQILGAFLGGFVSGVMGALTTAFNVLAGVAMVLTPVIQFVGSVIQALAPIFVTVAGFIGQLMGQFAGFNGVLGVVGEVVSSVFSGIIGFGSRLFSSLSGVFNNIANGFRIMGSDLGSVGRGIANTFSSIIGFAGRMVSGIIGAVSGVAGRIASHFSGVFGAISSAIGNVTSIGTNIVNGIAQGIRGAWGAVTSAIGALTDMIPKKIRSLLGIHSPSRVMRDMVGKFIPKGIAVGMTSQGGFISSHAQTLKDQLTGSMSNISLPSIGLAGGSLAAVGTSTSTTSNRVTINVNGANPDSVVPQIKRELRRVGLSTD
jgi:tape measure domain-containing protein